MSSSFAKTKKVDASQYFKSLEPGQVSNVLKNFYQELADGRKRFKDVLMKKYSNILQCEENFCEMKDACAVLNQNVATMHDSLLQINSDYLQQIELELGKQLTVQDEGVEQTSSKPEADDSSVRQSQVWQLTLDMINDLSVADLTPTQREDLAYKEQKLLHQHLVQAILPSSDGKVESDQSWRLETVICCLIYIKKVEQLAQIAPDTGEADSKSEDMTRRQKRLHKSLMRVVKRHLKIQVGAEDLIQLSVVDTALKILFVFAANQLSVEHDQQKKLSTTENAISEIKNFKPSRSLVRRFQQSFKLDSSDGVLDNARFEMCYGLELEKFVELIHESIIKDVEDVRQVLKVLSRLDHPMVKTLIKLEKRSWDLIVDAFRSFDMDAACKRTIQQMEHIDQDPIIKDVREDVYGVFVQSQDAKAYKARAIAELGEKLVHLSKQQISCRQSVIKHMQTYCSSRKDQLVPLTTQLEEESSKHKVKAFQTIKEVIRTETDQSYHQFILALNLQNVAYLLQYDDPSEDSLDQLLLTTFKTAIEQKLCTTVSKVPRYPKAVSQLKYRQKFQKVLQKSLSATGNNNTNLIEMMDKVFEESLESWSSQKSAGAV